MQPWQKFCINLKKKKAFLTFQRLSLLRRNDTLWTNATGGERQAVASGLEPFTYYVIKVCSCGDQQSDYELEISTRGTCL